MWATQVGSKRKAGSYHWHPKVAPSRATSYETPSFQAGAYSKHYVDGTIKDAYFVLDSAQKRPQRKKNRQKPVAKKRFVRIKETLHTCRDGKIRVSVRPNQRILGVRPFPRWFVNRAEGACEGCGRGRRKGTEGVDASPVNGRLSPVTPKRLTDPSNARSTNREPLLVATTDNIILKRFSL